VTDETQGKEREMDAELARRVRDVLLVGAMLGVVTALHQFTNAVTPTQVALHDFYRRLYYVPTSMPRSGSAAGGGWSPVARRSCCSRPMRLSRSGVSRVCASTICSR
jgi:hypothetical protein